MKKIKLAFDKKGMPVRTGDVIFDESYDYKILEVLKKNCVRVKVLGYVENKEEIINTKKCELEINEKNVAIDRDMCSVTFNGEMLCM